MTNAWYTYLELWFISFWLMPSFALKRILLDGFNDKIVDKDVADSVDFMVERVIV